MRSIFLEKPEVSELRRLTSGWRQVWVWLPAAIAIAVIMRESTDAFSSEHTSRWLRPIIEFCFGHLTDPVWERTHHVLRKCGHFCGYGLVSITFLRAWLLTLGRKAELTLSVWRWRSCGLAVLCTAAVASLDEWHQAFIPSRTGKVSDALLDTTGALVTCAMVWFFFWRRKGSGTGRQRDRRLRVLHFPRS